MNRGSIALYLLFSIAISIVAGYGVYRLVLVQRQEDAARAARSRELMLEQPVQRAAAPTPRPVAAPVEPAPVDEPPPISVSEQRAVDPDIDGDGAGALLGIPGIDGAMPRDSVERRFRARLAWWNRCYERSATAGEDRGVVHIAFRIEPDGSLVEPRITGGFNDGFTACLLSVAGAISFSGPRDGKPVNVVYPIGFR